VYLAALDQREAPEGVAYGPAQRLGAIDDEQAGNIRLQPALDQVGQQRLDHGGVLRRSQGHGSLSTAKLKEWLDGPYHSNQTVNCAERAVRLRQVGAVILCRVERPGSDATGRQVVRGQHSDTK